MASTKIQHFLLLFDHAKGELIRTVEFGEDSDRALASYAECEEKYRDNPQMDILLVGSDSIETVMSTHANYFDGTAAISRLLSRYISVPH